MPPNRTPFRPDPAERGSTMVELLIALTLLAIGLLAVAHLFPAGSRVQVKDRMRTEAVQRAREKMEILQVAGWSSADLSAGRHPAGTATEQLKSVGTLRRFYQVDVLPAPLDKVKRLTVSVTWTAARRCTVQAVTYLKR